MILSINPKNSFIDHISFPLTSSQSLSLSLSLSKGKKTRKKRKTTKDDDVNDNDDDECCDDARVCVLPSRVNKKGWSVVRRPKNAFFLVFFFSHKKKGKKKGRLFRVFVHM